ncbi:hypothetical protein BRC83_06835 [Halobacteriales archaeon QS_1_68_17]|nr:MAG: hypothetical protein BRC83_06835 [Halobacteriales archaeon QS_1_68_17]
MNLDELQSVQSRERQTDSLQQLRESFYREAGAFVQTLREERDRAAERADDPFDSPEVNRLTDDINTAERTVEAIYERRVGKLVKMASLAAADMPTEDDGLTAEEQRLFEQLVTGIEQNREHVLDVLAGEASEGENADGSAEADASPGPGPGADVPIDADTGAENPDSDRPEPAETRNPAAPEEGRDQSGADEATIDAADLMGDGSSARGGTTTDAGLDPDDGADRQQVAPDSKGRATDSREEAGGAAADDTAVDRATLKITEDVGEILGVDQRAYDLASEDVVTLPEANATPLLERDAAERID